MLLYTRVGGFKATGPAVVSYVETTALVTGAATNTASGNVTVNGTGPNRKVVFVYGYDSGAARTVTAWTLNGVAINVTAAAFDGSAHGAGIGYLDESDLPTDGAPHALSITLSGTTEGFVTFGMLYRKAPQGAAQDTDSHLNTNPVGVTLTSLAAGGLVVGCALGTATGNRVTWANSENERHDADSASTLSFAVGDHVNIAGASQAIGGTGGSTIAIFLAAGWAPD